MIDPLRNELKDKAFFVTGLNAWEREDSDPLALSAVDDAEHLLQEFAEKVSRPSISAGTTFEPQKILTLTWLFAGYANIRAVSISCKGSDRFDASWDEPNGTHHHEEDLNFSDLESLDIPAKIHTLEDCTIA